ncbi:MAG: DNA-directed RNA polymerase [Pseudomonadota bacterium]
MDWQPGDDPTAHPCWEAQVELEISMRDGGAERFRAAASKARGGRQADGKVKAPRMTALKPYRQLIEKWLPAMADGLRQWLRDVSHHQRKIGAGLQVISYPYLKSADPYICGYLTLRHVLDAMTIGQVGLMSCAKQIGLALEHEERMRAWERRDRQLYEEDKETAKANPNTFNKVQARLRRDKATAIHRRRVNINRFNKLMREPLQWVDWSEHVRTRIGLDLLNVLIMSTGMFSVGSDAEHVFKAGRPSHPKLVLEAKPELLRWLGEALERAEVMSPLYMPTIIPPKRWTGTREGAYFTPNVRTPQLIRFKAHQEDQRHRAADEYDALDMPKVYEALHHIQETPWKVNKEVLAVAVAMWDKDLGLAGLPRKEETPPPHQSEAVKAELEARDKWRKANRGKKDVEPPPQSPELLAWKRDAAAVIKSNVRRISHVLSTGRTLSIASRMAEEPAIYFPHMLDFRGRMYPIPQDLQPQGRDLARGLLTFVEGKPVEGEGVGWLAIHVANVWGQDKLPFDDRIKWTFSKERTFRSVAKDPFKNRQWTKADEPWQALAATLEWVRLLDEGEGMVSSLPIRVDGTCNGLQHLSAMVRDEVGGAAVNLLPGEKPRDIYAEVAAPLQASWEDIAQAGGEEGTKAEWWLNTVGGTIPRSFTKRQVMIMPYGGTRDAYFEYLRDWLDEYQPAAWEMTQKEQREFSGKLLGFAVKHLWAGVTTTVSGAVQTMAWLQECAKGAARGNQPIYWVTPSGFVVRHFYGKTKSRQVTVKLDGQTFELRESSRTKDLDIQEQLRGIAPNFVHSMDAACLTIATAKAKAAGIGSMTAIHDAYGTVAADMPALHRILREAFVEVYRTDVLAVFREACREVLATHIAATERIPQEDRWTADERADKALPAPLPHGSLDIEAVLESDYFFA